MFYIDKNTRFRQEVMGCLMDHFQNDVKLTFDYTNDALTMEFNHLSSPAKVTTMTEEDVAAGFYGGGVQEGLAGETFTIKFS